MPYYFSTYQIAEMAMQVEAEGAKFYKTLALLVKNETVKNVFTLLADEEMKHKNSFKKIAGAEELRAKEAEYSIDVCQSIQKSLDNLKAEAFRTAGMDMRDVDLKKAIEFAINIEKGGIRVYTEIYDSYLKKFQNILSKIIEEEKNIWRC